MHCEQRFRQIIEFLKGAFWIKCEKVTHLSLTGIRGKESTEKEINSSYHLTKQQSRSGKNPTLLALYGNNGATELQCIRR